MAYQDRIVTTRIDGKNWRIIHKTAAVEKVAKSITLPFPLCRVSKEARNAVFSAASCHIFVDNRFKKTGEVRKIHFRPGDQLYLQGFHNVCQRLQSEHIRFRGFGLGIGVKSIIIHPRCFGAVRADIAGFLRAVHSFEELEEIYVLTYFSRHADLHFQIANGRWHHYQLAANRSIAVTRDLADLLGNLPLTNLLTKPGGGQVELIEKTRRPAN